MPFRVPSQSRPPDRPASLTLSGVDTHEHVAVAVDELGAVLDRRSFAADSGGYGQLIDWAESFGGKLTFGIEGKDPTERALLAQSGAAASAR